MKKVVEYLPIISASLLFIGFINYTSYYRFFDIEIVHYLSSGELLLSFLPLTFPILFLLLIVAIMFIIEIIPFPGNIKRQEISNQNISIWTVFFASETLTVIKNNWSNRNPFRLKRTLAMFFLVFCFILGIAIIVFFVLVPFVLFPLVISEKLFPDWDRFYVIAFSFLWFLLLIDIISVSEKRGRIKHSGWINLFFIMVAFIFFVSISNKMNATDVLSSKPKYNVRFEFQGTVVQTDSNFVYVGRTTNHIFLRNLQSKTNSIYRADKIQHIELIKTNYIK